MMRDPEDCDAGFICKACGQWFADKDVMHWNTKWSEPDVHGERWLLELIHECSVCGEVRSYIPTESVFRGIWLGKP